MARTPSVILTPAEKKLAVSNAKSEVKSAKTKHAELTKAQAKLVKEHGAELKAMEKLHRAAVAEATKAYNTAFKAGEKELKEAAKAMNAAEAAALKFNPTVAASQPKAVAAAVPTPTE